MKSSQAESSERQLIIGLMTARMHTQVYEEQWHGVVDAAEEMNVRLVIYPGSALNSPDGFERQSNRIFDFVRPSFFDGLIIWTEKV